MRARHWDGGEVEAGEQRKLAFSSSEWGPFRGFNYSELNINGTCYKMKIASVRFGSLQMIRKEKTRSTINHRFAANVRQACQNRYTSLNSLRLN